MSHRAAASPEAFSSTARERCRRLVEKQALRSLRHRVLSGQFFHMLFVVAWAAASSAAASQPPPVREYRSEANWARWVHESGLRVRVEEYPTHDLAYVSTHLDASDLDSFDRAAVARSLAARLDPRIRRVGGWVEYRALGKLLTVVSVVPSLEGAEAVEAHLALFFEPPGAEELARHRGLAGSCEVGLGGEYDPALQAGLDVLESLVWQGPQPKRSLSAAGLAAWLQRRLRPSEAVLTIVGLVQRERVLPWVVEGWRRVTANRDAPEAADSEEAPAVTPEEGSAASGAAAGEDPRAATSLRYQQLRDDFERPTILLAFPAPPRDSSAGRRLELLRMMLAGGRANLMRLPRGDWTEEPLFSVRSGWRERDGGALLWFALRPGPETSLESLETRFFVLLRALLEVGVPPVALSRAVSLENSRRVRRLLDPVERGATWAAVELTPTAAVSPLQWPEVPQPESLAAMLRRYLTPEHSLVLELLPRGWEERNYDSARFQEFLELIVPSLLEDEAVFARRLQELNSPAPWRSESLAPNYATAPLRASSVLRGPEVYLKEDHAAPLVRVALLYAYPEAAPAPGPTAARLAFEAQLAALYRREVGYPFLDWELRGAELEVVAQPDYGGWSYLVAPGGLEEVFLPVALALREADPPGERELALARLELSWDQPLAPLEEAFGKAGSVLVDDPAYAGWWGVPPPAADDEVVRFLQAWTRQVHPAAFVVGRVSGTGFLQGLAEALSSSRFRRTRGYAKSVRFSGPRSDGKAGDWVVRLFPGPGVAGVEREIQAVIEALVNGPAGGAGRFAGIGEGNSELHYRRRLLARGGVQGIAACSAAGDPGSILDQAEQELAGLGESSVTPEEFRAALVRAIGRRYALRSNPEALIDEAMRRLAAGETPQDLQTVAGNLKEIRIGDVEVVIQRNFRVDRKEDEP
ncbi:MAG: hypothetical protein Kow00109_21670 [Acidobacteriota bacterium]